MGQYWYEIHLGNGDIYTWVPGQTDPKRVEGLENKGVKSIACGHYHYAAITHNGQLYTWYTNAIYPIFWNEST